MKVFLGYNDFNTSYGTALSTKLQALDLEILEHCYKTEEDESKAAHMKNVILSSDRCIFIGDVDEIEQPSSFAHYLGYARGRGANVVWLLPSGEGNSVRDEIGTRCKFVLTDLHNPSSSIEEFDWVNLLEILNPPPGDFIPRTVVGADLQAEVSQFKTTPATGLPEYRRADRGGFLAWE